MCKGSLYHCAYCTKRLTVSFLRMYGMGFCDWTCYGNWRREEDERQEANQPPVEM